jgi:predicted nucleic acid-binding protein
MAHRKARLLAEGGFCILLPVRVYLDNCCYNRPFDNQSDIIVRLEAEAVSFIQEQIKSRKLELVWSYIMDYENSFNPFEDRRVSIEKWRQYAKEDVDAKAEIVEQAENLMSLNIKKKDALHIACALHTQSQYFLTTDSKLLNKTVSGISIINPIDFLKVQGVQDGNGHND